MDSYHVPHVLNQLSHSESVARAWVKGTRTVSVQLRGGGVVKSLASFDKHNATQEAFTGFLEECAGQNVTRPSSYSDVFHQKFYSPRVPFTVNHYFEDHFAGAWQEAREIGIVKSHLFKYDLNSAYLWSGSLGLPVPRSFRYSDRLTSRDALYLVEIIPQLGAPFPFNRNRIVTAQ